MNNKNATNHHKKNLDNTNKNNNLNSVDKYSKNNDEYSGGTDNSWEKIDKEEEEEEEGELSNTENGSTKIEPYSETKKNVSEARPKLIASKPLFITGIIISFIFLGLIGFCVMFLYYLLKDMDLKKKYGEKKYDLW